MENPMARIFRAA